MGDCNREEGGVDRSLPSKRVIRVLEEVIGWRGKSATIWCDNGLECMSSQYKMRISSVLIELQGMSG